MACFASPTSTIATQTTYRAAIDGGAIECRSRDCCADSRGGSAALVPDLHRSAVMVGRTMLEGTALLATGAPKARAGR